MEHPESKFECRNSQFCMGADIGLHGRIFGARLMSEIDSVCAVYAAEICNTPWIVTKTMNIVFVSAIKPNDIYKTYVKLKKIGTTSITLQAEIRRHSVHSSAETVALSAETIFVCINEDGESIAISDVIRKKYGYPPIY